MLIEVRQDVDETGRHEEFTWDLFPLVDASETLHLTTSGLPKMGTLIRPGMIIVGKIARSRAFDPLHQPTALEVHGLSLDRIQSVYGHMWINNSVYATAETSGVVRDAYIRSEAGSTVAVVEIERAEAGPELDADNARPAAG